MVGYDEGEIVVTAAEAFTKDSAQCRPAQGKLPLRPGVAVAMPASAFICIQPGQRCRFTPGVRCQINMMNDYAARCGKPPPPKYLGAVTGLHYSWTDIKTVTGYPAPHGSITRVWGSPAIR